MSKNRQTSELINHISVDSSGSIVMTGDIIMPGGSKAATQSYVTTAISNLVASSPSTLDTLNELATALGNDANFATTVATSIGTKQAQLNGTGFVKASGTTISYDNSTYLTTSSASSTYLPLAGGTLTGVLSGTSAIFSSTIRSNDTNGLALGSIAGYRRIQYDLANTRFGLLTDGNSLANLEANAATFASTIASAGDITITKASATSFIANNTSASGKSYRLVSADDGKFYIQNTGILDLFNITSTGVSTFVSDIILSAANPFIFGGTAAGSVGISNIGGQSYIRVYGASHATSANVTQFVNAGSTSLTISSTGAANFSSRVNINGATDNASYALNIYGDATFSGTRAAPAYIYAVRGGDDSKLILKAGSTAGYFSQIDVSGWNGTGTPAYISLNSGNGTGIYVALGNNVGIGTINPQSKLTLSRDAESTAYQLELRNVGGISNSNYDGIRFTQGSDGSTPLGSIRLKYKSNGYPDFGIFTRSASAAETERFTILNNGNFGIGEVSPIVKLHVRGDEGQASTSGTTQNGILRLHAGSTEGWGEGLDIGMHVGITGPPSYAWLQSTNTGNLAINYNLVLNPVGGNVGVNTPNPLERFSVTGNLHVAGVGNGIVFDTDASGRAITQYVTNLYEFHILNSRGNSSRFVLGNSSISLGTSGTPFFFINTSSGNVGMGTTDFSNLTFGSTLLKVAGSRATLGLQSSGALSTIALIAGNNTATSMHLNFENTGAFRWYSYVSGSETFTLLGNGRLGLGVPNPDARLHVAGPILVSNNNQTYRRAITCYGQTGTYTQVKVIFNKSSWGSVVYDIKLASAGASHHTAGGYYSNPGIGSHVNSINAGGLALSFVSESQVGTQGQTWTFSGATMIHPILTIDIACGNGYQVNPDDIVVQFL